MPDHTKLRAFELADEVVILIYQVAEGSPKEELFGLSSPMGRAAVSVPSNIVEGCARESLSNLAFMPPKVAETEKVLNALICALRNG